MAVTYEPIASQTLGSDTTTVTFSDIPSTYTDLLFVGLLRSTRASTSDLPNIRFNSDSGNNYSYTYVEGDGSAPLSNRFSGVSAMGANGARVIANTATSSVFSVMRLHIMAYSNTNVFKTVLSETSLSNERVQRGVHLWRSTNAITALSFAGTANSANYLSGSTFSLYGVKAA